MRKIGKKWAKSLYKIIWFFASIVVCKRKEGGMNELRKFIQSEKFST